MAFQPKGAAKTNANKVRQQNRAASQGASDAEFASETDAQHVRQQNQQAESKKHQNQQ